MGILRKLSAFVRSRSGNVATAFCILLAPLTVLAGGAVDFNQAMNARARLSEALDAAGLAVATRPELSAAEAERVALDFIRANYPVRDVGEVQNLSVSLDNVTGTVRISGESEIETALLGLIGMNTITVGWETEIQQARQNLELVMVLDNTGSMSGQKLASLRSAALTLTDALHASAVEPDRLRIGLVPFAATVNVGTVNARAWWLDPDGRSPVHGEWMGPDPHPSHWELFDEMRNTSWGGCVEARPIPFDVDDTEPNSADPATLFVPYLAPDEPDIGGYRNDYLSDDRGLTGVIERLRGLLKYEGGRPSDGSPNRSCTSRPITPLTSSRRTIDTALNAMQANGNTNVAMGIGWGVRVLSPQAPFTEGRAYGDRDTIKAMIILTDGENVMSGGNGAMMSEYAAYGYAADGRLGVRSASGTVLSRAVDERTAEACRVARESGIRVYAITFQVRDNRTRDLMRGCASNPALYFDSPDNETLQDVFELIAGDLTNLRIAR
ncbi:MULTISPECIES: TadE/TadG family type IV pilus assembly protein [Hyphobacterium]|uniref:TadE/TadG family type IV pilus assembly protein n=1 Tax=Hyphobacterium vulgare TaxID=1736751 RepID=A0ABV6ZW48_9PROT